MARSLPVRRLTDDALWALVARQARCADSGLDPDQWYPVSIEPAQARREAAAAITICTSCPVRAQCLDLSLRHWDIGQHGVWGGLVVTDRAQLRRRWPRRPPQMNGEGTMAYGHAERNLALLRRLEAETQQLLENLNQPDPEQSTWLQEVTSRGDDR